MNVREGTPAGPVRAGRPKQWARYALRATARIACEKAPAEALDSLLRSLRWRSYTPPPGLYWLATACEGEQLWRFAGRQADGLADDAALGPLARAAEDELGLLARRLRQRAGEGWLRGLADDSFVRPTFAADLDEDLRRVAAAFAEEVRKRKAARNVGNRRGRIVLRALARDVAALAELLRPRRATLGAVGDEALAASAQAATENLRAGLRATAPRRRRSREPAGLLP